MAQKQFVVGVAFNGIANDYTIHAIPDESPFDTSELTLLQEDNTTISISDTLPDESNNDFIVGIGPGDILIVE